MSSRIQICIRQTEFSVIYAQNGIQNLITLFELNYPFSAERIFDIIHRSGFLYLKSDIDVPSSQTDPIHGNFV
jgi:hypothetical protein